MLDRLRIAAPDPLVTNFLEADALTSDIAIRPKGSAANCRRSGVVFMRLRQRSPDATSVQMGKVELDLYTRRRADPEAVKANETSFFQTFCISASWGSLIHATVGSFGGVGRPANRDGLAA